MKEKSRICKYDNIRAFLILLVVIGHMTTDYVSDSHMVRWITLWIYSFHMPAFVFISGLMHRRYILQGDGGHSGKALSGASIQGNAVKGEPHLRWDRVWGFFLCGYTLKIFIHVARTLMGQQPVWETFGETGIPWYLFVMAEYEILFYALRRIDRGGAKPLPVIIGAVILSSVSGYCPFIGNGLCLARMINYMPVFALGYYLDKERFLNFLRGKGYRDEEEARTDEMTAKRRRIIMKAGAWMVIAVSVLICHNGRWQIYWWRQWFNGKRSYIYLRDYFDFALRSGWWIRIAVMITGITIAAAVISVIPEKDFGFITTAGARTLQIYFWHKPFTSLFRTLYVLPRLAVFFGATYDVSVAGQTSGLAFGGSTASMLLALIVYLLIGAALTALFSLKIFEHPTRDLMALGAKIAEKTNSKKA